MKLPLRKPEPLLDWEEGFRIDYPVQRKPKTKREFVEEALSKVLFGDEPSYDILFDEFKHYRRTHEQAKPEGTDSGS